MSQESDFQQGSERTANIAAGLSLEFGDDGVALLEFDQPEAEHNRFTPELLERFMVLAGQVRLAADEGKVRGLVIASAKPTSFLTGVDVAAIASVRTAAAATAGARRGQLAFQAIAELPVRSVAAINGTCLGGGLEMALACNFRLVADRLTLRLGFPEINLGIIPGFGGSQRAPRLIALERALPLILTGRPVDSQRALRIGLVDAIVPAPLLPEVARLWAGGKEGPSDDAARRPAPEDRPWSRRLRRALLEKNPIGRSLVFRQAARSVRARTGGLYPAPLVAIDTVRRGLKLPLNEALQLEADQVGQLIVSAVSRNLTGLFFLRQRARREGRVDGIVESPKLTKCGVVGAGIMGGGLAQLLAYNGVAVLLKDIVPEALATAMRHAYRLFEERLRARRMSRSEVAERMGLISPTLDYRGFRNADLVIEAVVEQLEVKKKVLADVEAVSGPQTVLATNTSSLTIDAMSELLEDPGRLVGLHFFNPVHRLPLVEVVRGSASRTEAVNVALAFAVQLGKVPVLVKDAPGFFVNRVLTPYLNEALLLLGEGVTISEVDRALLGFGMPMGPLRLLDEIGLDIALHAASALRGVFEDRIPVSDRLDRLVQAGLTGRKGGCGFYLYPEQGTAHANPDATPGGGKTRATRGITAAEIVDRCVLLLLNEACLALEARIVSSSQEADLALLLGTGFPPFRGGVFRYAETLGGARLIERMEELSADLGGRFAPAPLLREFKTAGRGFYPPYWPQPV